MRRDVAALAAMDRRSAGEGERRSAEWVAGRLREAGASDVHVEHLRYGHTFAHAQGVHLAAGLAAAAAGGTAGGLLSAAALASFELDFSGRSQWLRRFLPAGQGANVVGRVPAAGPPERTLVLVAHHDAAHTGLMWHARLEPVRSAGATSKGLPSLAGLPALGFALGVVGGLAGERAAGRLARRTAAGVLGLSLGLVADQARSPTVPGASDNATGVAVALALAEHFAAAPLPGTEVVVLLPGCEESGMGGMAAWLRQGGSRLDPGTTFVLGLDTLGAGEPALVSGEGGVITARYREQDLGQVEQAARLAGLDPPRRWRIGGWTDPVLALFQGLPVASMISISGRGFPNYHLPTDTPDRVDWRSVERCAQLALATAESLGGARDPVPSAR